MKYFGNASDLTSVSPNIGVLLINLGTPERPVCPSLRKYLSEFLHDPRVIELPRFFRWLLVNGVIINFRAHKSARNYRKVWTEQGSPLTLNTQALALATQKQLGDDYQVEFAMRYGQPSIEEKLRGLHQKHGILKWVIIPLYPQYSGSTNGSAFDAVAKVFTKDRWVPQLSFVNSYHTNPLYIKAIAQSIQRHWELNGRAQKLVMSFHGVPKKYVAQGDPYLSQCQASALCIANELRLEDDDWVLVFQSRFGAQEWLQPYCDKSLEAFPNAGITTVDLVCPGFSADCLETLEEINHENRQIFLDAGGKDYRYIPCLNAETSHAELMADIVKNA